MLAKITTIIMMLCLIPTAVFAQLAMGRKANFAAVWPTIEYETTYSLSVGVHDQRPYVIDGQKSTTYAGTMRSKWGVPWNINTQSDKPLSDDIASAIVSGYKRVGIKATSIPVQVTDDHHTAIQKLKEPGAKRIVIITLREWKIDILRSVGFFIDAVIMVYNEEGKELASSSVSHRNVGSGDGSAVSVDYAARLYLNTLLNDDKIKAALGGSQSVSEIKEIGRDDRFIAYNNGTVIDTKTNLMWAYKDSGVDIDWYTAQSYCESYRGGGYKDWRMPAKHELFELYDSNKSRPSKCASDWNISVITELINISCGYLWTSERGKSGLRAGAATINFNDGKLIMNPLDYREYLRALPVRSAEITNPNNPQKADAEVKKKSPEHSGDIQKLRDLKKLKDEGFLTDKEYEKKRKAIIDGI